MESGHLSRSAPQASGRDEKHPDPIFAVGGVVLLGAGLAAMPALVASLEAWPVGLPVGAMLGLGTTLLVAGHQPVPSRAVR